MKSFAVILLFAPISVFCQSNYLIIRDSICPSFEACGLRDSFELRLIESNLTKLNIDLIQKGLDIYYFDLANIEHSLYIQTREEVLLNESILNYKKYLASNPKNENVLWNLAADYAIIGDCESAQFYLMKYLKYCKRKKWKIVQIKNLLYTCPNEKINRKIYKEI
jgi:hypothetical protein